MRETLIAALLGLCACAPVPTPAPVIDETPEPQPEPEPEPEAGCPAVGGRGSSLVGAYTISADTPASWFAGITRIDGDLEVGPAYIGGALSDLGEVTGSVRIHDNGEVVDLSFLPCLQRVGGDLAFANLPALTSLSGADGLRSIGNDLSVEQTPLLRDLIGLQRVARVGHDLSIVDAPNLMSLSGLELVDSIGGDLELASLWSLQDLRGLSGVRWIEGDLRLDDLDLVADLDGLQGVTRVSTLDVQGNARLTALTGLEGVLEADRVVISRNAALGRLDGLSGLTTVRSVEVVDNASLVDVSALLGIQALASLTIQGNPQICGEQLRPVATAFLWANDNQVGATCTDPSPSDSVTAVGLGSLKVPVGASTLITVRVDASQVEGVRDTRWQVFSGRAAAVTFDLVQRDTAWFSADEAGRFDVGLEILDVLGRRSRSAPTVVWVQ